MEKTNRVSEEGAAEGIRKCWMTLLKTQEFKPILGRESWGPTQGYDYIYSSDRCYVGRNSGNIPVDLLSLIPNKLWTCHGFLHCGLPS